MPRCLLALLALFARAPFATAAPIELRVDASEVTRKVIHARETIPAAPGQLTLHYPKWIPGRHRPVGQIANITEFRISAKGKPLDWKRDDADPFTIHCTVPNGATTTNARSTPTASRGPSDSRACSPCSHRAGS